MGRPVLPPERNGPRVGRLGGVRGPAACLSAGEAQVRFVAGRIAIDGALELADRFVERAGAERDGAEADVGGRRGRIERERLRAGLARARYPGGVLRRFVFQPERAAETGLREREARIEGDRTGEAVERGVDVAGFLVVEHVATAFEKQIQRDGDARAGGGRRLLASLEFKRQHVGGPGGHLVLEPERIADRRCRGKGADLLQRARIHQHVVDPKRVGGAQDATLEDQRRAEFPPSLRSVVDAAPAHLKRGSHLQPPGDGERRHLCAQRVGQPVAVGLGGRIVVGAAGQDHQIADCGLRIAD